MNSQNTDSDRIEVFKLTDENWDGSYKVKGRYDGATYTQLLKVSFFKLPPSTAPKEPPIWRTCVWGSGGVGMEYDAAMKEDAFARFMQVIRMEFVSEAALKDLGFVWA